MTEHVFRNHIRCHSSYAYLSTAMKKCTPPLHLSGVLHLITILVHWPRRRLHLKHAIALHLHSAFFNITSVGVRGNISFLSLKQEDGVELSKEIHGGWERWEV